MLGTAFLDCSSFLLLFFHTKYSHTTTVLLASTWPGLSSPPDPAISSDSSHPLLGRSRFLKKCLNYLFFQILFSPHMPKIFCPHGKKHLHDFWTFTCLWYLLPSVQFSNVAVQFFRSCEIHCSLPVPRHIPSICRTTLHKNHTSVSKALLSVH